MGRGAPPDRLRGGGGGAPADGAGRLRDGHQCRLPPGGFRGYDITLTQGGDEVDLLRRLRRQGRGAGAPGNADRTSSRRLEEGLAHTVLVSYGYYYAAGHVVNRLARRRVVGAAPPIRPGDEEQVRRVRRRWQWGLAAAAPGSPEHPQASPPAVHGLGGGLRRAVTTRSGERRSRACLDLSTDPGRRPGVSSHSMRRVDRSSSMARAKRRRQARRRAPPKTSSA